MAINDGSHIGGQKRQLSFHTGPRPKAYMPGLLPTKEAYPFREAHI